MRSDRINAIARLAGAKRYLEIGVFQGETFFDVDIDYKVAVDPKFQFDFRLRESHLLRFHELTSDDFFRLSKPEVFDVIYLDGLHTYEQTLRDFVSSLAFAHDKTIWLIDDTMPNDNFSALPDQERCYRLRRVMGNSDWAWMGDVFKTVYFVRNIMKFYTYRTFSGHGQTVIWRDISCFNDGPSVPVDKVGVMNYDDFCEHLQAMMNLATDASIYADLQAFFLK